MPTERIKIASLQELKSWVSDFAKKLRPKELLLLSGPLGAGKTQIVRFLLEALGSREACSPTFAIHNVYPSSRGAIDHVDLYRLKDTEDLESSGFWDLFAQKEGLIVIEWADRLEEKNLPLNWPKTAIQISVEGSDRRELQVTRDD